MSIAPSAASRIRRVFVRDLEIQARLGVHPHEKAAPQRVRIGVELAVEETVAPDGIGADELRRVVDYAGIVAIARAAAAERHTLLVETLAERIAMAALADPRVVQVRVSVEKPDAFADVGGVGVEIERTRR